MADRTFHIGNYSSGSVNVKWDGDYDTDSYTRVYVGDTVYIEIAGSGTTWYGMKYNPVNTFLSGFTATSQKVGSNYVYGAQRGTLTTAHLGSTHKPMAKLTSSGVTQGGEFYFRVWQKWYCTLIYHANGGSNPPASQASNVDNQSTTAPTINFTVSSTAPTKSNATFKGWATSSTAKTASYVGGNTVGFTGGTSSSTSVILYAVFWTNWKSYLKYDANTGSGAPSQESATVTQYDQPSAKAFTISSTTPTLSGYTFKGWSTTKYPVGTGTASYHAGDSISVAYSASGTTTTLYAVWEKSENIHVKVGGTWKGGIAWVNVGGTWKESESVWVKDGGTWKQGK